MIVLLRKIATILLLLAAAVIAFAVMIPSAQSETVTYSPSVESFYKVESDYFTKGNQAHMILMHDLMVVSLEEESVNLYESGVIDGRFSFAMLPANLSCVVLTDGWTWVSATWEIDEYAEDTIHAWFDLDDLRNLERLDNLYLILFVE